MATHRILVGDVLDMLPVLEQEGIVADMIFSDPKYNIGIDYGVDIDDSLSGDDYTIWTQKWLYLATALLREGGAFWTLINEPNADMMGRAMTVEVGPRINRVIWRETFGQYKDSRFPSGHRHLFFHAKGLTLFGTGSHDLPENGFTWNPDPIRIDSQRMKAGDKRAAGPRVPDDVWEVSRVQGNDGERQDWAPTQLRLWPVERAILCSTNPGDLVIDPFLGSGTTALAALLHGRHFIGIEINPKYAAMAEDRIAEYAARFPEVRA